LRIFRNLGDTQSKRKILVFHWRDPKNPEAGGAENLLWKCLNNLQKETYEVHWVCPRFSNGKKEELLGNIKMIRMGSRFSVYFFAWAYFFLHRSEYSLLIDSITGVPWLSPLLCMKKKLAIIYHLGKKETFFSELPAEHAFLGNGLASIAYMMERSIGLIYRRTNFVTFSQSTKLDLISIGIPSKRIFVIQEGISMSITKSLTKFNRPTVVYVGRLVKNKGVDYLIQAISLVRDEIPDVALLIMGRGYYENSLRDLVERLHLNENVTFLGYLPEREKVETLARSHCLVLPSVREGWATPIIEAASVRTLSIGTNAIGIAETIIDGTTGFLVSYGDPGALAGKLLIVLRNKELNAKLSDEAYEFSRRFSIENTINAFSDMISHLTN
jgi:glycosyltransferase involved in cell wall biosynthesis